MLQAQRHLNDDACQRLMKLATDAYTLMLIPIFQRQGQLSGGRELSSREMQTPPQVRRGHFGPTCRFRC